MSSRRQRNIPLGGRYIQVSLYWKYFHAMKKLYALHVFIYSYHDAVHSGQYCQCNDVIRRAMASQITSLTIVYATVNSDADQRKHQRSPSLAFVWGIHRWPVNSPQKGPVTRNMLPLDNAFMICPLFTFCFPRDRRKLSVIHRYWLPSRPRQSSVFHLECSQINRARL